MTVSVDHRGPVAVVTLDRPPVNALDLEFIDRLGDVADELASTAGVRAAVLRSAVPGVFMAGADLAAIRDNWGRIDEVAARLRRSFTAWERLPFPTVAAIGGHALGGGCELALTCDFRCMRRGPGRIGVPESRRGLLPAGGGTQRLVRLVGRGRALDLVLRGRTIDADEAERIGLVTTACDDLEATVEALTDELTALAPLTSAAVKRVILEGPEMPLDDALTLEIDAMVGLTGTRDSLEGLMSFLENRPPKFEGR